MPVKPIKPNEVIAHKKAIFPDAVMTAFNELIAKNFSRGEASFKQKAVVARMVELGLTANEISENNWLDVEEVFEADGWKVTYDKPGFNEFYDATFTFKKKKRST